ncbi:uncharacterized protein LOC131428668 [Malaya genurostris]|uniref:uncharacterized protein LOC131428668 n=1 Tax=Malaya genurostris TaxID=325434 RepID=UPI0026F38A12|nr:uncharacterized protein LOC131428668 [Malaya genurostris]
MAIRRFICKRGPPLEIFLDNGTNLKGASKELIKVIHHIDEDCANELTNARMKRNFNPPATPHMGGVWEMLVRSVKDALEVIDDGRRLTDEILLTAIAEAEDMINSRPLTYVPQSADEIETLSPNHFLRGVSPNEAQSTPPPPYSAEALRDAYKRSQQLASEMWNRWIKEYVPTLNGRAKWFSETKGLKTGDLVYVVEGAKRKLWVRGMVEVPIISSDGRVRQAWIRTNSGVFKRATANLAVLEIGNGNTDPDNAIVSELRAGEILRATPRRPNDALCNTTPKKDGKRQQEESGKKEK